MLCGHAKSRFDRSVEVYKVIAGMTLALCVPQLNRWTDKQTHRHIHSMMKYCMLADPDASQYFDHVTVQYDDNNWLALNTCKEAWPI